MRIGAYHFFWVASFSDVTSRTLPAIDEKDKVHHHKLLKQESLHVAVMAGHFAGCFQVHQCQASERPLTPHQVLIL